MPKAEEGENMLPDVKVLKNENLFSVKGKVCLVTGGGSGIGAMIAAGLCANGAKVYIVSRKDTSAFAKELTTRGSGNCVSLQADLSDSKSAEKMVAKLAELEANGVHVLVNNAGTNWSQKFEEYSLEAWDKVYNLNVRSAFHLSQKMLPLLEKAASREDPARIINISSIDGERVPPQPTFAYSSGKAALTRLTKVMAAHLSRKNVTVNAILPGAFRSRMMKSTIETFGKVIEEQVPMHRIGEAEDMAGTAIFLSSRASAWMTGAAIVLDGGAVLGADMRVLSQL